MLPQLIMIIAAVSIMVKVVEVEGRSTLFWGAYTFAVCIFFRYLISLPIPNVIPGLIVSYMTMFFLKLFKKNRQ